MVFAAACTTERIVVSNDGGTDAPVNRANGQSCERDDECNSEICSQGVCCNKRCDGVCSSCAVKTSNGTCVPVADGVAPERDVRPSKRTPPGRLQKLQTPPRMLRAP